MKTFSTIGDIQIERARAFPEKLAAKPIQTTLLQSFHNRNVLFDAVFYDVGTIEKEERPDLASHLAGEGAIIVVPPTGRGRLTLYQDAKIFLDANVEVVAVAVAGVGSSALGAAAFARNVADALGDPVAAVVSGYGLADLLTEAIGGYFLFGALNGLRHYFEPLDALSGAFGPSEQALEASSGLAWARSSKDTRTVLTLLKDKRFNDRLLIGHSKGNLVISEALYALESDEATARALAERCRIVTVSAMVGMPNRYRAVTDIIGQYDLFGALNSRPFIIPEHIVPNAWHSTNREFPLKMGIDVADTLRKVLSAPARQPAAQPLAPAAAIFDLPQKLSATLLRTAA